MLLLTKSLIATMLAFASYYSGLPIPVNADPQVTITQQFEGNRLGYKGSYAGITSRKDGSIGIMPEWNRTAIDGVCLLAHELTHYLQFVNGTMGLKISDNEPQAYTVEAHCYRIYGKIELADSVFKQGEHLKQSKY